MRDNLEKIRWRNRNLLYVSLGGSNFHVVGWESSHEGGDTIPLQKRSQRKCRAFLMGVGITYQGTPKMISFTPEPTPPKPRFGEVVTYDPETRRYRIAPEYPHQQH